MKYLQTIPLILLLMVVALFIALMSHDARDPGCSMIATGFAQTGEIRNLGGLYGAVVSDCIYAYTGWSAILLLALLVQAFWVSIRRFWIDSGNALSWRKWLQDLPYRLLFVFTWSVFIASGAVMGTLLLPEDFLSQGPGGILGQVLSPLLEDFGRFRVVLAAMIFLIALVLVSEISLVLLFGTLWRMVRFAGVQAGRLLLFIPKGMLLIVLGLGRMLFRPLRRASGPPAPAQVPPKKPEKPKRRVKTVAKKPASDPQQGSVFDAPEQPDEAPVIQKPPVEKPEVQMALPDETLLDRPDSSDETLSEAAQSEMARRLETVLGDYGIQAEVMEVRAGPVITQFALRSERGFKVASMTRVARDVARALELSSLRVVETIEGKSYFGIEIPNAKRQTVSLHQAVSAQAFKDSGAALPMVLGVDIAGGAVTTDMAAAPHLLIAGATGSGKSVGIHSMLVSLLLKNTPEQLRLVMIDPKRVEFQAYKGLPHLMAPIVADAEPALSALNWCVDEMERRYSLLEAAQVQNIEAYNAGAQTQMQKPMPRLLLVVDELADLMMTSGKQVELAIVRIAQKARAAGMHMMLATQRPSVNVITGLIKSNVPSRIAFRVAAASDSRIVLDQNGAELLLGGGDMLFSSAGGEAVRVHGAFVSMAEVERVADRWRLIGAPEGLERLESFPGQTGASGSDGGENGADKEEMYEEAVSYVRASGKTSVSAVQRQFRIGFNRAARLIERMEEKGVLSTSDSRGKRRVL